MYLTEGSVELAVEHERRLAPARRGLQAGEEDLARVGRLRLGGEVGLFVVHVKGVGGRGVLGGAEDVGGVLWPLAVHAGPAV